MKKKIICFFMVLIANFSLIIGQTFIVADDIYYQKGDELKEIGTIKEELLDTNYNILILEPEVDTYEEGVIIYKNDEGINDTIYIYGNSELYLNR